MASLLRKPKKTKPKIIEINENEDNLVNESSDVMSSHESRPLISANQFGSKTDSVTIVDHNSVPTAPPEEAHRPTGLADPQTRTQFVQKVYLVLCGQKSLFVVLLMLFTFVPHLRKVFRKWVFDPLFLTSFIGVPLVIFVVLLAISSTIRRKFAFSTLLIITASLSLLLSYAITQNTAKAFLYSMGFSDLCDLGVVFGSKARLDFTKWRYISLIPMTMIGSSVMAPTILNTSLNNTIWPSIVMTSLNTYLAANTVPVIRHNDLHLEPNEYIFAATQLYLNPERSIKHKIKNWLCGPNERPNDRSSYAPI